jgi:hypothetical protein
MLRQVGLQSLAPKQTDLVFDEWWEKTKWQPLESLKEED